MPVRSLPLLQLVNLKPRKLKKIYIFAQKFKLKKLSKRKKIMKKNLKTLFNKRKNEEKTRENAKNANKANILGNEIFQF